MIGRDDDDHVFSAGRRPDPLNETTDELIRRFDRIEHEIGAIAIRSRCYGSRDVSVRRMSIEREQKKSERPAVVRQLPEPIVRELEQRIIVQAPIVDVCAVCGSAMQLLKTSALVEVMRGEEFPFAREIEPGSTHERKKISLVVQEVAQADRAREESICTRH